MARLNGTRVGITAARRGEELAELVRRLGGIPELAPAMSTLAQPDDSVERAVSALAAGSIDWLIGLTGIGIHALWKALEGRSPATDPGEVLRRVRIVARGAKAVGALRRLGLSPTLVSPDATVQGVAEALRAQDMDGCTIAIQWAGQIHTPLRGELAARGATVVDIHPYAYGLPDDLAPVRRLVAAAVSHAIDAIAFTHARQVDNLFLVATDDARDEPLRRALSGPVTAAAVGRVTAQALHRNGVEGCVVPATERMGPMVAALADALERRGARSSGA